MRCGFFEGSARQPHQGQPTAHKGAGIARGGSQARSYVGWVYFAAGSKEYSMATKRFLYLSYFSSTAQPLKK
jgi:hypothetical protein